MGVQDPNNPVEAIKRRDLSVPQGANTYAALDLLVWSHLPRRLIIAVGLLAAVILVAVIVYVLTR